MRMFKVSKFHWQLLWCSAFLMISGNLAFLKKLCEAYAADSQWSFVVSVMLLFIGLMALALNVVCHGRAAKWVLSAVFFVAALSGYFMDTYGTVIDGSMLSNALQTNWAEASDVLNVSLLSRLFVLGVLPSVLMFRILAVELSWAKHLQSLLVSTLVWLALLLALLAMSSAQYASFFREHKSIRFYSNPSYPVYSIFKSVPTSWFQTPDNGVLDNATSDALLIEPPDLKELVILVVGETARADHFSLNGYARQTNPELSKEQVLSFKNVTSCGTSTAISVPCMFSTLGVTDFSVKKALRSMNALDVLQQQGIEVLWRDNNSDSKGVATRVPFEDFRNPTTNKMCDEECRDEGMLLGLDAYIQARKGKDILIVLHQMGNHGPAYYKRYPGGFERFKPACRSTELSSCSQEQIVNAYDNAILYTDYFLSKVIALLKRHDDAFETAMLYVSDHGESLGEHGLYLHGAPMSFAPKEQTHVPAIVWTGQHFEYSVKDLKPYEQTSFSHDDLFCTLMLAYEVQTKFCDTRFKPKSTAKGLQ